MQRIDMTAKVKKLIRFGIIGVLAVSLAIGYAEFSYWHTGETIRLENAKIVGTMVSVRVLANGKVKEILFEDGAQVQAGETIAQLEVNITEEEIHQLEETVQLAKDKYAELAAGQMVRVPVQRERVIAAPATPPQNLEKLKERAARMAELFEMGAVSAVQRDAARRAYESALANSSSASYGEPVVEYYTEYVEEFRPTPPEVLAGAEQAIKQAELSLNVAKQEARETAVIAPVSGTIYYGVEAEQKLDAGDSVARIGDKRELWIEAEVSEEIFDKIALGKLVSYTIDGKKIFGTVTEKIKPDEKTADDTETIELPKIPDATNAPAPLIGETPPTNASTPPANTQTPPTNAQTPPQPPKIPENLEPQRKPNDKFIIKISLPAERDFDCRPNTTVVVTLTNRRN